MEAKEKANQIFDLMYEQQETTALGGNNMQYGNAKRCALIAVDEIEKALDNESGGWNSYYWQQVKTEIEKL